jgi:acyl carrier protein
MTKKEVTSELERIMELSNGSLTQDTVLETIEAWDSMAHIGLLSFLDKEFEFNPPVGALENCKLVGDLIGLVEDKLEKR